MTTMHMMRISYLELLFFPGLLCNVPNGEADFMTLDRFFYPY
jgi:hypothetical protein